MASTRANHRRVVERQTAHRDRRSAAQVSGAAQRARKGDHPIYNGLLRAMINNQDPIDAMRSASPLPVDAQRLIDTAVVEVGLDQLVVFQDLISRGLVYNLPNWMGVTQIYWEKISRAGGAQRAMVPGARGENQRVDRGSDSLPVYLTFDDFGYNVREAAVSERAGAPLDTAGAENATRNVNEAMEDQAVNGLPYNIAGMSAPGLLNAPNHNTSTFTGNESWTDINHAGEDFVKDFQTIFRTLKAAKYTGPFVFVIPTDYGFVLDSDYKSLGDKTIRERLLEMDRVDDIITADRMPDDTVAVYQPTRDVIDVVLGQQPTAISYSDNAGFNFTSIVMGCAVVRVKSTYERQSGILIATPN